MRLYSVLLIILFVFTNSVQAQQNTPKEDNSISGQFNEVIEKTSSYQHYKVVPKSKLIQLKSNVSDSLLEQKKVIADKNQTIESNNKKIQQLNQQINNLETEYEVFKNEKESMSFFGISMHKSMYSLVMWLLLALLVGLAGWYFYQFSKSNIITKKSVESLQELQKEYDEHRKIALEREQKVRRQLQDEINKNRGV